MEGPLVYLAGYGQMSNQACLSIVVLGIRGHHDQDVRVSSSAILEFSLAPHPLPLPSSTHMHKLIIMESSS